MTDDNGILSYEFFQQERKRLQEEYEERNSEGLLRELFVKRGEIARFWFLMDIKEFPWFWSHTVEYMSKKGKKFWKSRKCPRGTNPEAPITLCKWCENDNKRVLIAPVLTWVDMIAHTEPDSDGKWPAKKSGDQIVYVETVNDVRLYVMKTYVYETLEAFLKEDVFESTSSRGTMDQPFVLSKQDKAGKTLQVLTPRDPMPIPAEGLRAREEWLPKKEEYIENLFEEFKKKEDSPRGNPARYDAPMEDFDLDLGTTSVASEVDGEFSLD